MVTVNVLYPNKDGAKFDMNYYLTSHIPMLKRVLGSALKGCIVEQGSAALLPARRRSSQCCAICASIPSSRTSRRSARSPVRSAMTWRTMRAKRRSSNSAT